MNHAKGSSQSWRAPLREALDFLRDGAAGFFDSAGRKCFEDPWQVRDEYGEVVDERLEARQDFVARSSRPGVSAEVAARGLLLLEMQRSLLLMYTSCAWFFDDIAGGESGIALQCAAHAIDLWRRAGGVPPEQEFLERLSRASSNDTRMGTGVDAFARASAAKVGPEQALARAALARLLSENPTSESVAGFSIAGLGAQPGNGAVLQGQAEVCEARTGTRLLASFSAVWDGVARLTCDVAGRSFDLDHLAPGLARPLRVAALARLAQETKVPSSLKVILNAASLLGELTREERRLLGDALVRALVDCLEVMSTEKHVMNDLEADQVLGLLQLAGMASGEDLRRAKDLAYEHLEAFRQIHQLPPKSLQVLAERLDSAGTPHARTKD